MLLGVEIYRHILLGVQSVMVILLTQFHMLSTSGGTVSKALRYVVLFLSLCSILRGGD